MKVFKKKRTKIPRRGSAERLIRKISRRMVSGSVLLARYRREIRYGTEFPLKIRELTLARMHAHDRGMVLYYPDLRNFQLTTEPNRSLPVEKFLNLFKGMFEEAEHAKLLHDLTNYRLEFNTTVEDWVRVYADDTVKSCMTNDDLVKCYVHPENHLALAALYAPGGNRVIARSIVNLEEKWYVRNYGDTMLVKMLQQQGYTRLDKAPSPFKMYGRCSFEPIPGGPEFNDNYVAYPYFDFPYNRVTRHRETFNPVTKLFEVTVS